MHPILFEIPGVGFPIRSFGVLVAAGIFLGIWVLGRLLARYGDDPENDPERGSQVAMWLVVGIVLGARLMYVVVESARYLGAEKTEAMQAYLDAEDRSTTLGLFAEAPEDLERARALTVGYEFMHDPLQILFVWQGGLVMYGGLIGGILLGILGARKYGLRVANLFDTAMISAFIGLSVGRWGCLLVGDDYGKLVPDAYADLPFPITLTVPALSWLRENPDSLFNHDLAGQALWATQVWMSVNALLVAFVGWLVLKRRRSFGQAGAVMLIHYSITRFAIEAFRGDEIRGLWFNGAVSTSQLVSIAGLLVGLFLLWKGPGKRVAPPPVAAG